MVQPYSKPERLLNLLMALRAARYGLDRATIRAQVRGYDPSASEESFLRMFERDKEDLRSMGITLIASDTIPSSTTRYRVDPNDVLADLHLERSELAVLAIAARVWDRAGLGPAALNALRKVEARLGIAAPPGVAPIIGLRAEEPALRSLIAAAAARQVVRFEYRKPPWADTGQPAEPPAGQPVEPPTEHPAGQPASARTVQPWRVVWWLGRWYLVGMDLDRGEQRVFRVSRVMPPVRPIGEQGAFQPPADFDARAAVGRFQASQPGRAQLALAPGAGGALRRAGHVRGVDQQGWDLLDLPYQELGMTLSSIAACGPAVRVLEPDWLRAQVCGVWQAVEAAHRSQPRPRGRSRRPGPTSQGAAGQFARMLALVPWLAANDGVSVPAAAEHFGISEEQLLADLGSVITSGADDWTLFDIQYWDESGTIRMIDALDLAVPLSLSPDEALALVIALDALAAIPGTHDEPTLAAVAGKLRAATGARLERLAGAVAVRVDAPGDVVALIDQAIETGRTLELTYHNATRDELTERTVDPIGIVVLDGHPYLRAGCRRVGEVRHFRLDRMVALRLGMDPIRRLAADDQPMQMADLLATSGRTATVDLAPDGLHVLDRHPVQASWDLADGWVRAELPVGQWSWVRGLAMAGGGSIIVRQPADLAEEIAQAAGAARAASCLE